MAVYTDGPLSCRIVIGMAKSRLPRTFLHRFVIFFLGLLILFGGWRYGESNNLISQGNTALKEGNPEEAVLLFLRARDTFPLRFDVNDDLKGARLILESDAQYGNVYQISEQVQEVPPGVVSHVALKPNEYWVPILMYHHIRVNPRPRDPVWAALNVTSEQLDSQLNYLMMHGYHAITLDELTEVLAGRATLPDNPVILTFDDGYQTFYDNAFPILQKYHMKAVSFVITGVLTNAAYMTWDEVTKIDKSGLVQFAAHTRQHPSLVYLSPSSLLDEIKGSKDDLEAHLHKPIRWFAYPYGSYNDQVVKVVKDAGFVGAVSTIYGAVQSGDKIYLLPRIMVDGRFTLDNVVQRLSY